MVAPGCVGYYFGRADELARFEQENDEAAGTAQWSKNP
jgi:hypothetical protein